MTICLDYVWTSPGNHCPDPTCCVLCPNGQSYDYVACITAQLVHLLIRTRIKKLWQTQQITGKTAELLKIPEKRGRNSSIRRYDPYTQLSSAYRSLRRLQARLHLDCLPRIGHGLWPGRAIPAAMQLTFHVEVLQFLNRNSD